MIERKINAPHLRIKIENRSSDAVLAVAHRQFLDWAPRARRAAQPSVKKHCFCTVSTDETLDVLYVLDLLSSLVDKSLVVAETTENPRYRLLESTRAQLSEDQAVAEALAV